jgi:hypothetical protein
LKEKILATIIITFILFSFTIPAATSEKTNKNAGNGVIRGIITNEDNEPLFFVRIYAIGEKTNTGRSIAFTYTHLFLGGKGSYKLDVDPGRYVLIRAAKLPFYIGAKAGPIVINSGETKTLDLSLTSIRSLLPIPQKK